MSIAPTASQKASINNAEFIEERKELRREYLSWLLAATVPFLIITILRAAAWRRDPSMFYTWPVAVSLGVGLAIAYSWSEQRPRMASWAFILTLILANTLEMRHFPAGPAPYLFAVIAVAAALLHSEAGALGIDALLLLTLGLGAWSFGMLDNMALILQAVLLIALCGFVSVLGTHQLYTVLQWEWHSTQQAIQETHNAQAHRAEMMQLNKELDGAYNRLERMNRMLVLARKEAEEARMLKVQFANAVSHELRSPLNLIIGFSDMMVNSPEVYGDQPWSPRLKNHILQIYQSSQHLSQLVDDVLDMARIDAYRLALNKQRLSISEVITEAMDITRSLYDARNLYLRVEVEPDLPDVPFDRTRIRQVLLNFLTNALRFTRQGGVTVRARLSTGAEEPAHIIVSVTDTGVGIGGEDLPKLFQEFTQLGGSIYRQGQGFGLGLAISKQLVELHGGRVMADSVPGQGSTFSFTLPLDPSLTAEIVRDAAHEERFWSYLEQQASERKPVLVCAPDSTARRLLASQLTAYDVTWINDERQLGQAIATQPPAAVVRIEQPGDSASRDAFTQNLHGIPLINCSLPGLTRKPWISALNDYLVKPISRRKLLDALRRLNRDVSRVLIVEDEAPMREFLSLTIASAYPRCAIRMAESGQHAIHFARELAPDVILLDLTLPDADGLELATQLRELTKDEAAIVAVTARDYPAEQGVQAPDEISCARSTRFSQRELERLLNALLDATSPSGVPVNAGIPANERTFGSATAVNAVSGVNAVNTLNAGTAPPGADGLDASGWLSTDS